jgi:ADP-L-glycero-D-manno-heptose 6-epimerase
MASVVYHAHKELQQQGGVTLFRSHHPDFKDGEQKRDFIYVRDIASICYFMLHNRKPELSGIYNAGTGKAQTFLELVRAIFRATGKPEKIRFVDTPADIRDTYQYYTQADMSKLRGAGYEAAFTELVEGVSEYLRGKG